MASAHMLSVSCCALRAPARGPWSSLQRYYRVSPPCQTAFAMYMKPPFAAKSHVRSQLSTVRGSRRHHASMRGSCVLLCECSGCIPRQQLRQAARLSQVRRSVEKLSFCSHGIFWLMLSAVKSNPHVAIKTTPSCACRTAVDCCPPLLLHQCCALSDGSPPLRCQLKCPCSGSSIGCNASAAATLLY